MKQQLYFVEVGVLLDPSDKEFEYYKVKDFFDYQFGFYDENRLTFLTYEEARKYCDKYIEDGVDGTYAILQSWVCNIDDNDLEEIKNNAYSDYNLENPQIENTLYFAYNKDKQFFVEIIREDKIWKNFM